MPSRRPAYRPPVESVPLSEKIILTLIAFAIMALLAGLAGSAWATFTDPF